MTVNIFTSIVDRTTSRGADKSEVITASVFVAQR
jgi:hypothetical protein